MKQTTFAALAYDAKKKCTRREYFPTEMDAVIPWKRLRQLIESHYPVAGQGTPAAGVRADVARLLHAAVI